MNTKNWLSNFVNEAKARIFKNASHITSDDCTQSDTSNKEEFRGFTKFCTLANG